MFYRKSTVYEHQVGLKFIDGKVVDTLVPGRYVLWGDNKQIVPVDLRLQMYEVGAQDTMTADGATVRVSLHSAVKVADAKLFYKVGGVVVEVRGLLGYGALPSFEITSPRQRMQVVARAAIRDWVGERRLEEVLAAKGEIAAAVEPSLRAISVESGLELIEVTLVEAVVTGNIRAAYADLLKAELEGKAALQRARNEAATMRSLINTARLTREHPGLLELRVLTAGQKPRINIVVGQSPSTAAAADAVEPDEA